MLCDISQPAAQPASAGGLSRASAWELDGKFTQSAAAEVLSRSVELCYQAPQSVVERTERLCFVFFLSSLSVYISEMEQFR